MSRLKYTQEGYNLTENPCALPQKFVQVAICSELYVEFLKTSTAGIPIQKKKEVANHEVFKIVFAEYDGYKGMRLEMDVDYDYESTSDSTDGPDSRPVRFKPGLLHANPTVESRPSSKTALTCRLSIEPNWTVGRVIGLLLDYQSSNFDFVNIDDRYFGCRDFVTQAIYLMHNHGFIRSTEISAVLSGPTLPVTSIYDALGLRVDYKGRILACPIDKGRFSMLQRYDSPSMPYKGSQRALELAESIAR